MPGQAQVSLPIGKANDGEHQPAPSGSQVERAQASQPGGSAWSGGERRGVGAEADEGAWPELGQAADTGEQHQPERDQRIRPM